MRVETQLSTLAVAVVAVLSLTAGPVAAAPLADGPGATSAPLAGSQDATAVGVGHPAQTDDGSADGDGLVICERDAATFVGVFNRQIDEVPGLLKGRVRDTDVHLRVDGEGGGDYTMVTDEDSQVTDYSEGEPASATVRVVTDCDTFRNITDAEDPGAQFRSAYANDRVRFVGLTAPNWVVFQTIETITDPISLAIVLLLFLLGLLVLYLVYRRLAIHYRDEEPEMVPEDAAGETDPGDGPVGAGATGGQAATGASGGQAATGTGGGQDATGPTDGSPNAGGEEPPGDGSTDEYTDPRSGGQK
jgi:hypothetical protein